MISQKALSFLLYVALCVAKDVGIFLPLMHTASWRYQTTTDMHDEWILVS